MLHLIHSGLKRNIWLWGDKLVWVQWVERLQRPPSKLVISKLQALADLEPAQLVLSQKIWKFETGTEPKIFAIRIDQARMYCCLKGQDIVIVDWDEKKQSKANRQVLERAQRRAREVLEG